MDLQAIMQRIKQLKDQLLGQQDMLSPVPPPESQDDYNSRMIEKMRAVKGGETPDQETVNLMRKQADNGLYPEGNKYLGTAQPEVLGTETTSAPLPQAPVQKPMAQAPVQPAKTTIFQKPKNADMGYIRPEHQKFLETHVFPETDAAGLPRELVAGQWAGEGGRKTENPDNNLFGIGPHMKFKDLPSNIKTYTSTVKKLLKQRGIDDPSKMSGEDILAIMQNAAGQRYEGHNPDPSEYPRFIQSIPEYRYYKNQKKKN